jgi:hypothetical protein
MTTPTSLVGNQSVVPLPFAPASLNGLSERMMTSHHENNYGGAVRNRGLNDATALAPGGSSTVLRDFQVGPWDRCLGRCAIMTGTAAERRSADRACLRECPSGSFDSLASASSA